MTCRQRIDIETIAQAERYSPANAIDEVTEKQLWHAVQATPGEPVEFPGLGEQEGESHFAYAYQRIYSRVPQHAAIFLGNDDFHKLWVNGELLKRRYDSGFFQIRRVCRFGETESRLEFLPDKGGHSRCSWSRIFTSAFQ